MKPKNAKRRILMGILIIVLSLWEVFAQCPTGWSLTSNRTKLYLYFAAAADATFPEYYTDEVVTSPLNPFNVSDLDASIGTTAALRNRIIDIVKEDYCEFDVEIAPTTTTPSPTESQWQIVGIGSDAETDAGSDLFGVAQDVDLNNSDPQDYARVFARSFSNAYGGVGGALNGANSTLERWATAVGHTVSHEAGHNFGLMHSDSTARPGEDEQNFHMMATGSTGLTGEMRASRNRHFGDREYEILGHNIGLRISTLYNWDFINPNAEDAHSLVLTLLSPTSTLTLNWFYGGSTSPWTNPTVASAGTQSFQGTTYNKFTLTFNTPKAWGGGPNGVVPGGVEFHVGASFAQPDLVLVYETRLKDNGGSNLSLHPRMVGFNAGAADVATGDFAIRAFNPDPSSALIIESLQVSLLPRMASIDTMVEGARLQDVRGVPIPMREPGKSFVGTRSLEVKEFADVRLASFTDDRFVDQYYDSTNCKKGRRQDGAKDVATGEIEYCPQGWALSLFPSTYVYVVATVVEPNVQHWDRTQGRYVTGPLRSKVFYQFAGTIPDFNKNGVDDLIDIRTNISKDANKNGIVDEAEKGPRSPILPWWLWFLILFLIVFLIWLWRRRRKWHVA